MYVTPTPTQIKSLSIIGLNRAVTGSRILFHDVKHPLLTRENFQSSNSLLAALSAGF